MNKMRLMKSELSRKVISSIASSLLLFSASFTLYASSSMEDFSFSFVNDEEKNSPVDESQVPYDAEHDLTERLLITIISEPENGLQHALLLDINEKGDIVRFIRRSKDDQSVFTPQDMVGREVVLARASDRDAVLLGCPACTETAGGKLVLRYLNNGLTNSYKTFEMNLVREDGFWSLYAPSEDGKTVKVHTLRLRSRVVAGVLIGVRKIEVNI